MSLYRSSDWRNLCAALADINFENRYLNIDKTLIRIKNTQDAGPKTKLLIDEPKTAASRRRIPLSYRLNEMLLNKQKNILYEDAFFLTGTEKFIEPRCYYNRYKDYLKKCELSPHTFHALRHTFATRCIEKGVDPKTLSELLGHADVKITLDRYVHPSLEHKRNCMELLFS